MRYRDPFKGMSGMGQIRARRPRAGSLQGLFQFVEHTIDLALGNEAVIIQDRPEEAIFTAVDVIIAAHLWRI